MACNEKHAFFTSEQPKRYNLWSCQKVCDHLHYLLDNYQTDVAEALKSTSIYLNDLLDIDNPYFGQLVSQIYPTELQLN